MTILVKVTRLASDIKHVGKLFREARGELTQEEFAKELGVTLVHISRVERSLAMPSLRLIMKLEEVLENR
jgi:transcriptional regulator with XRE-family HTH domain